MTQVEVLIIGAGAAGLFCAGVAAQQGLQVLVLDHSEKVAEKIRISGGGRSNFTNNDIDPHTPHKHFLGENPQFARSALSRYTAADFVTLVQKYGIAFHEKHKGPPTLWPWYKNTASLSTKNTRDSCFATAVPKT